MKRSGFTLLELLIVLTTLGMLMGIAIPSLRSSIKKANITAVIANMRTLNLALQQYAVDYSQWPPHLDVNTFEPLVSGLYLREEQVKAICKPLVEERLGAYVLFNPTKEFIIFFKMKIIPNVQFYLFPDGVYIKNPVTKKVEKFDDYHMRLLIRK